MSSTLPPPPPGPPGADRPEFLDSGSGGAFPPPPPAPPGAPGGRRRRRRGLVAGGTVVGLVAVAGGAFGVYQVAFATGDQAAEALPASTVGYVGVDLDPSGKQKLEALDALEKFPAFQEYVDVDNDDDLRKKLFDAINESEGEPCQGLDFDADLDPWLGDRFAFAAVDVGEEVTGDDSGIAPVAVIQVTDADKADQGLDKLAACDGGDDATDDGTGTESESSGGWSIQGDWAVLAETDEIAQAVTDAAQDDPLSDDDDFKKWTEAAGDPGILSAYASPAVGPLLADELTGSYDAPSCLPAPSETAEPGATGSPSGPDDAPAPCSDETAGDDGDDAAASYFEDFEGGALTVRFADGGLEVESASSVDLLGLSAIYGSDRGDDVVASLPDDTAIAMGVGFEDGWFGQLTEYVKDMSGGALDLDAELEVIEQATGLQLPEDAEALDGRSVALAASGDVDLGQVFEQPAGQPVGLKVDGDPAEVTDIIDRLLANPDVQDEVSKGLTTQTDDDHAVAGYSEDWNARLLEGGNLGDSEAYRDVVKEADKASSVLFVNFNEGDWLQKANEAAGGDQEVIDNLTPLKALGVSGWTEDGVSHSVLRITVD